MFTQLIRSSILYILVVLLLRAMGKRQIGQMQPYELVITLMIADFAASPLDSVDLPLINGILPIIALVLINCVLTICTFKSQRLKNLVVGKPSIVVRNGRIDQTALTRQALTVSDLLEQIRLAGFPDISSVGVAILETSGQMSVFPVSQARSLTPGDMGLRTGYETAPLTLIVDGKIQGDNLVHGTLNDIWLAKLLKQLELRADDVLLMTLSAAGVLFAQLKIPDKPLIYRKAIDASQVCW